MYKRIITSLVFLSFLIGNTTQASQSEPSRAKDIGVINKDKILYWLEKRGEISSNATANEKQAALSNYIGSLQNKSDKLPGALAASVRKLHQKTLSQMKSITSTDKYSPEKIRSINKVVAQKNTTVKVLAIMVDFPDLKFDNHQLTPLDTSMHYDNYPASHYQDLLFSVNGYDGPSGQNIESAYQYYQHESGEGFSFTGNTYGWVTADNNAEYYGANNNDGNDDKTGELIIDAVSKAVADHNLNLEDYDKTDYFDKDNDGIINEPDGIVDHVMIFHSSIGEEAGGGILGSNAIWSHRFFVFDQNNEAVNIPGSNTKIYGYTINPIDSATGVVVHEFAHDLGVPDEYDTKNTDIGSPVSGWSVMASGSWLGSPRGTSPSSFSPYAKEYFQTRYDGNWINQQVVGFNAELDENISLVSATNHNSGVNQVRVNLPKARIAFGTPFTGDYQYHSDKGHQLQNKLSFTSTLGSNNATLSMKARWDIEQDYDYVQVKANNQVISGNQTKVTNEHHFLIKDFISGKSSDIVDASPLGWVELTFDLSSYKNQTVAFEISYITDEAVGGYGFVTDDIKIMSGSSTIFEDGAESSLSVTLDGFNRIGNTIEGKGQYYYIQLRDNTSTDSALTALDYDPGVLLWYGNDNIENNNVSQHAGDVFLGVVDADQNIIKRNSNILDTERQLRDAAFSLYQQSSASNDSSLDSTSLFRDTDDYSSPTQPESGITLPKLGFTMEVITQASNSSSATIKLETVDASEITVIKTALTVNLSIDDDDLTTTGTVNWDMGDGTQLIGSSISHTYQNSGSFDISVTYNTITGNKQLFKTLTVGQSIEGDISLTNNSPSVSYSANLTGGFGDLLYRWNFGDAEGASSQSSGSYTFSNAGTYTVSLDVTDETGETFTFTKDVTVLNPLSVTFTSVKNNLSVDLTSNPTGGSKPYTYLWDFGDNNTSTESNPKHTYSVSGSYSVTLTITDADDKSINSSKTISVTAVTTSGGNNNDPSSKSSGGGSVTWLLLITVGLFNTRRSVIKPFDHTQD